MNTKSIKERLQALVNKTVARNKMIHNSAAALARGDGSLCCCAASGLADPKQKIPMTTDTPFFTASVTKLYTATLIMQLFEQKKLQLDDPIGQYLPEELIKGIHVYKGTDYTGQITIRHLLGHTSGIADYYLEKPEGGKSFFERLINDTANERTPGDTIARARDQLASNFPPGKKTRYSDTNYQLLGLIIEAVCRKSMHDVFREQIFEPLQMHQSALYLRSEPKSPFVHEPAHFFYKNIDLTGKLAYKTAWADGGIISTIGDGLTFLLGLNQGLFFSDEATLPLMHEWRKMEFSLYYGYGTMNLKIPRIMSPFHAIPDMRGHFGSTGTAMMYCPDEDLYLVAVTNQVQSRGPLVRLLIAMINLMQKGFDGETAGEDNEDCNIHFPE